MQLKTINQSEDISIYKIESNFPKEIDRYIISTPETRDICNKPEVLGVEYTEKLKTAVAKSLKHFKDILTNEENICVFNFLRGSLNFHIREALNIAFNFNKHNTSFMSSQRFKEDGRWGVKENMYRKLNFPKPTTLLIGDVVATGVTMQEGINLIYEEVKKADSELKDIIFFTIGCHKIEKVFENILPKLKTFKNFNKVHIIYFEGKFKLVDSKTELKIGIPGTDLIRKDCLLSPEFEQSQLNSLSFPLERCTIYDAGSRSFQIKEYREEVLNYWGKTLELANNGFTLKQALEERLPNNIKQKFFEKYTELDSEALKNICKERISTI